MEASMTALANHRRFSDEARGEAVLTERELRGCAVMFVPRLSRLAGDTGGSIVVIAVTPGIRQILALASHPWLAVTGDLDTALETVSDRAGTSS
jgi:hypothetical protein